MCLDCYRNNDDEYLIESPVMHRMDVRNDDMTEADYLALVEACRFAGALS